MPCAPNQSLQSKKKNTFVFFDNTESLGFFGLEQLLCSSIYYYVYTISRHLTQSDTIQLQRAPKGIFRKAVHCKNTFIIFPQSFVLVVCICETIYRKSHRNSSISLGSKATRFYSHYSAPILPPFSNTLSLKDSNPFRNASIRHFCISHGRFYSMLTHSLLKII